VGGGGGMVLVYTQQQEKWVVYVCLIKTTPQNRRFNFSPSDLPKPKNTPYIYIHMCLGHNVTSQPNKTNAPRNK
jgi:hypothetical protein